MNIAFTREMSFTVEHNKPMDLWSEEIVGRRYCMGSQHTRDKGEDFHQSVKKAKILFKLSKKIKYTCTHTKKNKSTFFLVVILHLYLETKLCA